MLCDNVISVNTLHNIFLTRMSPITDLLRPNQDGPRCQLGNMGQRYLFSVSSSLRRLKKEPIKPVQWSPVLDCKQQCIWSWVMGLNENGPACHSSKKLCLSYPLVNSWWYLVFQSLLYHQQDLKQSKSQNGDKQKSIH